MSLTLRMTTTNFACVNSNGFAKKLNFICDFNTRRPGKMAAYSSMTLQWRHNEHDGVSNHKPYDCLRDRLFRRRSKKTPKLCVPGLCEWNSPVTGEFLSQRASNAENVFIWWRHHGIWLLQGRWTIVYTLRLREFRLIIHAVNGVSKGYLTKQSFYTAYIIFGK